MDPLLSLFDPQVDSDSEDIIITETRSATLLSQNGSLPPECEEGNIEYKLKLINPSKTRFEHLVTQMKWRLREGHGEAIYEIGVEDKGLLIGLSQEEVNASLETLYLMADKLGATITILRERIITNDEDNCKARKYTDHRPHKCRKAVEVLVRKVPDDQQTIELRIAVLGNVETGKSTLLGVLTQGETDNGRGSARLNLFRHRHEIQTGRTSSISKEILGFDNKGVPITYNVCRTPEEICEMSSKLLTFIDLGGHQKYLKTTVFGLIAMHGHYAVLVISSIGGVFAGTAREHLGLALALEVPVIVVVNKIDITDNRSLTQTLIQLETLLKSPVCKKIPVRVETEDDVFTYASRLTTDHIIPIFTVSCVSGYGLNLLYKFLYVLPPSVSVNDRQRLIDSKVEFQIDETFQVPEVGLVVSGLLISGLIREGDYLKIGPFDCGLFSPVQVSSLQRHKVASRSVRAAESATLALMSYNNDIDLEKSVRKGMVLIEINDNSYGHKICQYFQARIHVLFHVSMLCPGFQTTIYIGNVRQTAVVVAIMGKKYVSTNESASVMFRFIKQPEYIKNGSRLLFREGPSKGIGHIVQVFPIITKTNDNSL
ncbi:GTP-binding protein 2-like [Oppia nitens]|uniref:GTP-binding protein 2-like n=1 Tax=Oppia nitens TaxID=1686743 RepID=UPI0023DB3872|nr:GTP-binding protein 2-like [Oppia nitens]